MAIESEPSTPRKPAPPAHHPRADGADLILAALDFLRGISSTSGETLGPPTLACQETRLREWAESLGLLLNAEEIIPRLERGGLEHDWFREKENAL